MSLRRAMVVLLVAGLVLMIPFEATITRVLGIACLFAFVVCGVFAVAEPGFLGSDDPQDP